MFQFGTVALVLGLGSVSAAPIHHLQQLANVNSKTGNELQVQSQSKNKLGWHDMEHLKTVDIFTPFTEPHQADPWAIDCVSSTTPSVAFTFDDGPFTRIEGKGVWEGSLNPGDYEDYANQFNSPTDKLLDELKDLGIKATFFAVGVELKTAEGRRLLKREHEEGHAVGAHTMTHPHLGTLSIDEGTSEFQRSVDLVGEITGVFPSFVRSPYGERPDYIRDWEAKQGLTEIYWRIVGGEGSEMLENLDKAFEAWRKTGQPWPNPIVLFHDWSPFTVTHIRAAAQKFKDNVPGIQFLDMYDCLGQTRPY